MDQTSRGRLEIPVPVPLPRLEMPVENLNATTWVKILSEAKERGLSEVPIAGTCKMAIMIRSWPESTETHVDLKVFEEKFIPNFQRTVKNLDEEYSNYAKDCREVAVSYDPSTLRKGSGPIFIHGSDSDESDSDVLNQKEHGSDSDTQQDFNASYTDDDSTSMLSPGDTYDEDDRISMLGALREELKFHERIFKRQYSYGVYGIGDPPTLMTEMMDVMNCIQSGTPCVKMDVRHCITSLACNAFALPEMSSGISWVGVHSGNDICVATLTDRVDCKRVQGFLADRPPNAVLSTFRKCVLSELEDLADPSSKLCEKLHRSIDDVPFCVVSESTPVYPETPDESGHETSIFVYDVPDAVSLVQEGDLLKQAKDRGGAIKLAISTFQRLMACEAEEIEVTVVSGLRNGRVTSIRDLGFPEFSEYLP